jgi:glycosyltransferase involved in cell wall biosynthesis
MNVLLVLERFEIGGVVSYLEVLSRSLVEERNKVIILGGLDKEKKFPFRSYFKSPGIKIYTYLLWRQRRWLEDISRVFGPYRAFTKIINGQEIDLIAFNQASPASGIILHPKSKSIPKVFHFHGAWDIEEKNAFNLKRFSKRLKQGIRMKIYYQIEKFCLMRSDKILSLSQCSKKLLKKHFGVNGRKIEVVSSGVDRQIFKPVKDNLKFKRKLTVAEDVPLLFVLGRFDKKKGIENMLKAVKLLKDKNYRFKVIIAGPVDSGWFYNREIFRLYEKFNLQTYVQFVHRLSNEEKHDYFQAADLFVFPSIGYEAYPYVIMEAMSMGLPVIATPVGGVPDMLRDLKFNLMVEDLGPKALADKIEVFLNLSGEKRRDLGEKHLNFARKNFDGRKQSKEMLRLYNQLILSSKR